MRKEGCVTAYNSLKMREALLPRINAWELQGLEVCIVRPDQARRYREPCRDPFQALVCQLYGFKERHVLFSRLLSASSPSANGTG